MRADREEIVTVKAGALAQVALLIEAMRPRQWIKNLLIFAGVFYAGKIRSAGALEQSIAAFALFCAITGAIYIFNDICDLEQDRHHPRKRLRPIASGRLGAGAAAVAATVIGLLALFLSFAVSTAFGLCAVTYAVLTGAYSLRLKRIVILDILLVAIGFVLRALAGTLAVGVETTPWFLSCVLFLALFISICKRRHELLLLSDRATNHRAVLRDYSPAFLDQMVAASAGATVLSYALWTVSVQAGKFPGMVYTVPFVIYGIFRYLFLVYHRSEGGAPEVMFLTDRSLLIGVLLWFVVVIILIYQHGLLGWLPTAG